MTAEDSEYMHFAKTRTGARFNLASSGVLDCAIEDLDLEPGAFALHGSNAYGHAPLVERLAARFGVPAACVVTPGGGTSFANHLAMAALLEPGDEVLVEHPAYPLITDTLRYLRATVRRFERRPELGWQVGPEAVAEALTPRTRLVVVTDLHNPSGAALPAEAAGRIAAACDGVGAVLLVDEVYRELLFADGLASTAFHAGSNVVVTSSLTKAYGLSGLRCGWCLAPAPLAERMRRLNDLFASLPSHPAECMAVAALDRLPALRARAAALLEANRAAYREVLGEHPGLEQAACAQGTTMFPRLRRGDGDALYATLMGRFETSVVPGRFFGCADRVRVGLAGAPAQTRCGLARLAEALG